MGYPTTLIVPGLHGSGQGHWQDCWRIDQPDCHVIHQSNWSNPDETQWLSSLERAVAAYPNSLLVCHSLGSILTAKFTRSPLASTIRAAVLVAPADVTRTSALHRRKYEFGTMPHERLPFPSLVVASRNDAYMSFAKVQKLAADWGSQFHDLGSVGHINIASGFGRWTGGYALAATFMDTARAA